MWPLLAQQNRPPPLQLLLVVGLFLRLLLPRLSLPLWLWLVCLFLPVLVV